MRVNFILKQFKKNRIMLMTGNKHVLEMKADVVFKLQTCITDG